MGDQVNFSIGLAYDGRKCVNALEHMNLSSSEMENRAPLFPRLKSRKECMEELHENGASGKLLFSFGVDKEAQKVVKVSEVGGRLTAEDENAELEKEGPSNMEGEEKREVQSSWEPLYNKLVELSTPLIISRKQTLKAMQRVGLPLVLGAALQQGVDVTASPREYDVVCFRRTLSSLMDATLDPVHEGWFALDTNNSLSQLQKVSFLMKRLSNGTLLIDEGFNDSSLLMNSDSFGRQFERLCVIKPSPHVKPFQAYEIPLSKVRMLVFTPPDAMTRNLEPVEIKLRLPPLTSFTDREEFFKGLTNLKHVVLGFGRKIDRGKKVEIHRVVHQEKSLNPSLMRQYSSHLENVIDLAQQHVTNPECTYILRRKNESIVFSEIDSSTFLPQDM
eukprot:CAMPEP_0196577198 /NCGR_PEP_ID=MMETSP1081-20130531/6303_1 /TAXON_ID=36882 /ORGANISM="Pyramimonas amylifera, Strain CCMP720" /LENGTH=388 /DNA_ID=CAMNT_0041896053 /DNA_START=108 /DNA_END=1274 /DNA_ORIENTATION=+